ncbi:MAG: agmatine deiminase family protein [Alphaproteobacteria bacterium]|nr:agmatine deiminase family protein [Alphaproteobacteria bacterium]
MSNFLMPAEWAPQKRIWLSWPHNEADWPGKFAPVPYVFAEMVRLISRDQRVGLLVKDSKAEKDAKRLLKDAHANLKHVDFVIAPTDRGWLRDCGPIWVKSGKELVGLDWGFNAWAKYPNWKKDTIVPTHVLGFTEHAGLIPKHKGKQVTLEGGGIEVDGEGSIIVTEEWLLSKKQIRNPGFTRKDYEQVFAKYLGAENTIWLGNGIVGDDTHGHVDDITRFVAPGKIVTVVEHDKKDANYKLLQDNLKRLNKARDAKGKPFEVIDIPMPRPVMYDGERLPASYANFLICNKVVLVPVFNDVADKDALDTLQACFPTREVIGIYARDLVWGLGTIHCLTQQEPA